jgi:hypothetical protein
MAQFVPAPEINGHRTADGSASGSSAARPMPGPQWDVLLKPHCEDRSCRAGWARPGVVVSIIHGRLRHAVGGNLALGTPVIASDLAVFRSRGFVSGIHRSARWLKFTVQSWTIFGVIGRRPQQPGARAPHPARPRKGGRGYVLDRWLRRPNRPGPTGGSMRPLLIWQRASRTCQGSSARSESRW